MRRCFLGIGLGLALLLGGCSDTPQQSPATPLRAPYDLGRFTTPPDTGLPMPPAACTPFNKPPVRDLVFSSVYEQDDPSRSRVDEAARKTYIQATRDLRHYEHSLMAMANAYLASGRAQSGQALCALDRLHQWAAADALLGKSNTQGAFVRQWTLATLSSAYLQIKSEPTLDAARKETVERWLGTLAAAVIQTNETRKPREETQNNHLYWAAWAVTITGIALNNTDYYVWGVNQIKYVINVQMNDDGSLPLEMKRGAKALHYHIFALAPLIMVAEAGARNGDDIYDDRDGILHRLVDRVFNGLDDPAYFETQSGSTQEPGSGMQPGHFAWLEAYNARFPAPPRAEWLHARRPLISRRTGGDMTLLYTYKEQPAAD